LALIILPVGSHVLAAHSANWPWHMVSVGFCSCADAVVVWDAIADSSRPSISKIFLIA
jgi:hypothetical protein